MRHEYHLRGSSENVFRDVDINFNVLALLTMSVPDLEANMTLTASLRRRIQEHEHIHLKKIRDWAGVRELREACLLFAAIRIRTIWQSFTSPFVHTQR